MSTDIFIESTIYEAERVRRKLRHENRLPGEEHVARVRVTAHATIEYSCGGCGTSTVIIVRTAPAECVHCGDLTSFVFA